MNDLLNKQELLEILNISRSSLNNYIAEGLPVAIRGKQGRASQYKLEDVQAWLASKNKQSPEATEDMTAARLRKLQAEASLAELELQKERGELIEIAEVAKQLADAFARVRAKLLTIPTKTSGLVYASDSQREVQKLLDDAVREVLEELSTEFLEQ